MFRILVPGLNDYAVTYKPPARFSRDFSVFWVLSQILIWLIIGLSFGWSKFQNTISFVQLQWQKREVIKPAAGNNNANNSSGLVFQCPALFWLPTPATNTNNLTQPMDDIYIRGIRVEKATRSRGLRELMKIRSVEF